MIYKKNDARIIVRGMKDGIPICLGYFAVSFAFGMLAVTSGLSVLQAVGLSLTNLTSAGQVAGVSLIQAGAAYYEMALTQLIINLRYCLMSFSLSQKIDRKAPFFHRFFISYGITDEIFAVAASQKDKVGPGYIYGLISVAAPGWVLGTLCGAVAGNLMPASLVNALGIAIYGMFLAIIIPQAKSDKVILACVAGAMVLSALFGVLPGLKRVSAGFVIIIVTVVSAGTAAWLFPVKEPAEEDREHGT